MEHQTYEDANHVSVQDAVSCAICNPRSLTLYQYESVLEQGLDTRDEGECLNCKLVHGRDIEECGPADDNGQAWYR
jgi:hypothetical protein